MDDDVGDGGATTVSSLAMQGRRMAGVQGIVIALRGEREEDDEEEKMGFCCKWKGLLILAKILKP